MNTFINRNNNNLLYNLTAICIKNIKSVKNLANIILFSNIVREDVIYGINANDG